MKCPYLTTTLTIDWPVLAQDEEDEEDEEGEILRFGCITTATTIPQDCLEDKCAMFVDGHCKRA